MNDKQYYYYVFYINNPLGFDTKYFYYSDKEIPETRLQDRLNLLAVEWAEEFDDIREPFDDDIVDNYYLQAIKMSYYVILTEGAAQDAMVDADIWEEF